MPKLVQRWLLGDTPIGSSAGYAAVVLSVAPRPRNFHGFSAPGALASLRDSVHSSLPEILLSARRRAVRLSFTGRGESYLAPLAMLFGASVRCCSALVGAEPCFDGLGWLSSVRFFAVQANERVRVALLCSPARDGAEVCGRRPGRFCLVRLVAVVAGKYHGCPKPNRSCNSISSSLAATRSGALGSLDSVATLSITRPSFSNHSSSWSKLMPPSRT